MAPEPMAHKGRSREQYTTANKQWSKRMSSLPCDVIPTMWYHPCHVMSSQPHDIIPAMWLCHPSHVIQSCHVMPSQPSVIITVMWCHPSHVINLPLKTSPSKEKKNKTPHLMLHIMLFCNWTWQTQSLQEDGLFKDRETGNLGLFCQLLVILYAIRKKLPVCEVNGNQTSLDWRVAAMETCKMASQIIDQWVFWLLLKKGNAHKELTKSKRAVNSSY